MELAEFRVELDAWLDEHEAELQADHEGLGTLDQQMAHLSKVKRIAYDDGWMRWGWPERVGGLGGSPLLRGYLGEALTTRDLVEPGIYSMTEVLAPTMIDYARPELAAEMVPRLLRGDETWCQGFSEPGTGSNLASLSCRATRVSAADAPDGRGDGWLVNGQKVWTSLAQFAQRCVPPTRTGPPRQASRAARNAARSTGDDVRAVGWGRVGSWARQQSRSPLRGRKVMDRVARRQPCSVRR